MVSFSGFACRSTLPLICAMLILAEISQATTQTPPTNTTIVNSVPKVRPPPPENAVTKYDFTPEEGDHGKFYLHFLLMNRKVGSKVVIDKMLDKVHDITVTYKLVQRDEEVFSCRSKAGRRTRRSEATKGSSQSMCMKEVAFFGYYNYTTENFQYSNIQERCDSINSTIDTKSLPVPFSVYMDKVLPNQAYSFTGYDSLTGENLIPSASQFCIPKGKPVHAPQSDLGLFTVLPRANNSSPANETIGLYWRPLPRLFRGSDDTNTSISCQYDNSVTIPNITLSPNVGYTEIDKLPRHSLKCALGSYNEYGRSSQDSPIIVPARESIKEFGRDFKFYVVVYGKQYFLEWTPVRVNVTTRNLDILPRANVSESRPQVGGVFTIVWCNQQRGSACQILHGIVRAESGSSHLITIHSDMKEPRQFGISFVSKGNRLSTGIYWANCIAKSTNHPVPLVVVKDVQLYTNGTQLGIAWSLDECNSITMVIDYYEVKYCEISHLDDCTYFWFQPTEVLTNNSQNDINDNNNNNNNNVTTSEKCTVIKVENKFQQQIILENLQASTRYHVQMRYHKRLLFSPWSKTLDLVTDANPDQMAKCKRNKWIIYTVFVALACVVLLVLAIKTFGCVSNTYSLYVNAKTARTTMTSMFADISRNEPASELNLKYCVNREKSTSSEAQSELSLSFIPHDEENSRDDDQSDTPFNNRRLQRNFNNHILDYIPRSLVEGNIETSTPENSSEDVQLKFDNLSEQDDISISSHPLIWNVNANNQLDFNNNQASNE